MGPKTRKGKGKAKPPSYLSGATEEIEVFNANLAVGFTPTETSRHIAHLPPNAFPANADLCAINALTHSLNAARAYYESGNIVPLRPRDVALVLDSAEYRTRVDAIVAGVGDVVAADYNLRTYIDRSQLTQIMDVLNERHGTNYILGFLTITPTDATAQIDYEAPGEQTGRAVVWIAHTGEQGRDANGNPFDSRHFTGFTQDPAQQDDDVVNSLNSLDNTGVDSAQRLVNRGLYLVNRAIPGGRDRDAGVPGQFVVGVEGTVDRPSFLYGRLGVNPGTGTRFIPRNSVEQINEVVDRPWANPPFFGTATPRPKRKRQSDADTPKDDSPSEQPILKLRPKPQGKDAWGKDVTSKKPPSPKTKKPSPPAKTPSPTVKTPSPTVKKPSPVQPAQVKPPSQQQAVEDDAAAAAQLEDDAAAADASSPPAMKLDEYDNDFTGYNTRALQGMIRYRRSNGSSGGVASQSRANLVNWLHGDNEERRADGLPPAGTQTLDKAPPSDTPKRGRGRPKKNPEEAPKPKAPKKATSKDPSGTKKRSRGRPPKDDDEGPARKRQKK